MKLFNSISSQIVIGQNDQSKYHPRPGQINHLGHAGHVQNEVSKMTRWLFFMAVQNGFFLTDFPGHINH